ncbi:ABC-F family ATP-binding cassette domain-containing protein [Humidisolicoccus flavus]|uniref:ABC-F family ATP-binding cassette domain-containing protein n=1 Tax=Humidisolicoccus flavus TaxID=3111414 RepID=UPI0032489270
MAHLLGAESLHLEYPNRVIFKSVTIGIEDGDRIGIVGRNGDGKSTLLRLLSDKLEASSGRVTKRGGVTIGMLDQADELASGVTIANLVVGDRPEHEWAGDERIRDVLRGLLADLDWSTLVDDLSGGQRRRVALAALLVGDWDVLFLDEPTNHLDVEGIAWLAEHLVNRYRSNRGALAVVTHDRWFLDEVCTATWEVHDGIIEPFEGGYAAYILQRVERDRMAAATESKRQNLMRKELAWLRRGAPARTTKPKFRIDAATQLIENEPPVRDAIQLSQLAVARLGKDVVDIEDASVRFGDTTILNDITWRLAPGERTGILGQNGVGKSTLLSLITGRQKPTEGRVKRGVTVKVAELTQQLDELREVEHEPVRTVIGRLRTSYSAGGKELTPGQLLERLGFGSNELTTRVSELSGGQRRRLQLLLILLDEPNVLILDEPTNDLDTDMLAAMEDLLDTWPGTLIVVSHDRYLIERITDQQYAIVDQKLRHLPGGVDEYLKIRDGQARAGKKAKSAAAEAKQEAPKSKLGGAERRSLEKESASLERRIQKANARKVEIQAKFTTTDVNDFDAFATLQAEMTAVQDSIDELEIAWLAALEKLDS